MNLSDLLHGRPRRRWMLLHRVDAGGHHLALWKRTWFDGPRGWVRVPVRVRRPRAVNFASHYFRLPRLGRFCLAIRRQDALTRENF